MDARRKRLRAFEDSRAPCKVGLALSIFLLGTAVTPSARAKDCVPSCREGYLCHQGQCIEACNPPCAEGERCVGEGECVAEAQSATASEPVYTPVATGGGAVDTRERPSTTIPATFVGLGGFLLIAGGVTFGTSEWSGYYGDYWGTGQYVGVVLMAWGAISLATATPFLVRQTKAKRKWDREHARMLERQLTLTPVIVPGARSRAYGMSLRGHF